MAQLFFKYGTMNSGKSIELLKTAHNYREQGKEVVIMTSALDTRSGVGKVSSRIGLSEDAIAIKKEDTIIDELDKYRIDGNTACILVDEAQFLTEEQVIDLAAIVDKYEIPVICYGLKTDFQGKLFEGSKTLIEYADKIEEIKTVCYYCNRKATMNMRLINGKPTFDGEQVQIGDEEYLSICREDWLEGLREWAVNKYGVTEKKKTKIMV